MRPISILILLSLIAPSSFAADISPGKWALSMETRVAASPDFAPQPYTLNQCLTEQDAQDPSRVLGGMANPGASDCIYTEKSFSGTTFRFKMRCAGSFGIQASGEIAYTSTTMDGNIVSTATVLGQPAEFQMKVSGHRLGDCTQVSAGPNSASP